MTTSTPNAPVKANNGWTENLPVERWKQLNASQRKSTIANMLHAYSKDFGRALPKFITPERYLNTLLTSVVRNPSLLECDPLSLWRSWMHSAMLGLEPDTPQQHCHAVAFYNGAKQTKEAQLIIGYRGMVELAYRSGKVASIEAHVVYDSDQFKYKLGDAPYIDHDRNDSSDIKNRKVTHAYAIIRLKGSENWPIRQVMSVAEIEQIRAKSKAKDGFAWSDPAFYPAMCMKTVLRRALKLIPNSRELANAIALDDMVDVGETQPTPIVSDADYTIHTEESQEPAATKSDRVANKLKNKVEENKPEETAQEKLLRLAKAADFSESDLGVWIKTEFGCGLTELTDHQLQNAIKGMESFKK